MPKNSVADWSETAADNTDVGGINIAEGCAPSGINNAIRTLMSQIKAWTATLLTTTAATFSASEQAVMRANISSPLKGHLYGLTLSNNSTDATNDIDIAAGEAASTESNPVLMVLASALTKRLDASWAVGTSQGGLDTGSIANTTYHVWLIQRSDTGVVDVLFSASATAPTMPTNYDRKRRIGSIIRESAAILGFRQEGDEFWLEDRGFDLDTTGSTSGALVSLTVPTGIIVRARMVASLNGSATRYVLITSPLDPNTTPTASLFDLVIAAAAPVEAIELQRDTDTSGQMRHRLDTSGSVTYLRIWTLGWVDRRQ